MRFEWNERWFDFKISVNCYEIGFYRTKCWKWAFDKKCLKMSVWKEVIEKKWLKMSVRKECVWKWVCKRKCLKRSDWNECSKRSVIWVKLLEELWKKIWGVSENVSMFINFSITYSKVGSLFIETGHNWISLLYILTTQTVCCTKIYTKWIIGHNTRATEKVVLPYPGTS